MSTKSGYTLLIIEVLICFLPITGLWILGCVMFVAAIEGSLNGNYFFVFVFPVGILLIMGGIGLIGLYQIIRHIYVMDDQPVKKSISRKLYMGIISLGICCGLLLLGNIESLFSVVGLIFILPVICSLHLIRITKSKEQTPSEKSIFNDV